MTNDYKANLLEYLTGNIVEESKSTTPLYENVTTNTYDGGAIGHRQVRCKDGTGNYNGKVLYYNKGGNTINLLDSNMNVLKTFTTFSSGTSLGTILNLEIAEDGNVYGLDYITVNGVITYRIILLNNISEIAKGSSDYEVILRNSYYIQGYTQDDDLSPTFETFIQKSTQSATYYFAIQDSTGSVLMPSTFQINVGSSNTWTRLTEYVFINGGIEIGNIYFNENDTPVAEYYATEYLTNDWTITKGSAVGEDNPTYTTVLNNVIANYYKSTSNDVSNFSIMLKGNNYNGFYMILTGAYKSSTIGGVAYYKDRTMVYYYRAGNIAHLLEKDSENETILSQTVPSVANGIVINDCMLMYIGNNSIDSTTSKINFTLVSENNDINYFIDTNISAKYAQLALARIGGHSVFNLYSFSIIYVDDNNVRQIITIKTIYNSLNYNGENYKNINMLAPIQTLLFDNNNNILFARNLYNKKVYQNQTMSVVNIPYNMLNNGIIAKEKLYGDTGYDLIDNNLEITKNVYEDLYINFINAISMVNENTDTHINNFNGSSRLNKSISKALDYNNAKASKIRVNYDDNTSYITSAYNSITNNICTYQIGVHVPSDKNIESIEIMSNDETTTYQTISSLNLENNKYYIITQDVYVV